jgi:large subunit ribosomal protein L21
MFAIVSIAGQQFKVEEGQQIFVHRLAAQEGDGVSFDAVHLIDRDGNVTIGAPNIGGAKVSASVLGHVQGDKVVVFKKKRRKGYRKKNGHRQQFTKIKINTIVG